MKKLIVLVLVAEALVLQVQAQVATSVQVLSSDPSSPAAGTIWLNTGTVALPFGRLSFSNTANQLGRLTFMTDLDFMDAASAGSARASLGNTAQFSSTPFSIVCFGDSHCAGILPTAYLPGTTDGEVIMLPLRQKLQAAYGSSGVGFVTACSLMGCAKHPLPYGVSFSIMGGWHYELLSGGPPFGLDDADMISPTMLPATITLSCEDCDEIEMFFKQQTGQGTFSYTVDGGSPSSVNLNVGAQPTLYNLDTGVLTNRGYHWIVITVTSTPATVAYGGGYVKLNKNGVQVNNAGLGSSTAADNALPFVNFNVIATAELQALNPNLILIAATGSNECTGGIPVTTFAANLHSLYQDLVLAASPTNPAFAFVTGPDEVPSSGCTSLSSPGSYSDAIRTEALTDGVPVIDLNKTFSPYGAVQIMLSGGTCYNSTAPPHLNVACGDAASNIIIPFITGAQAPHPSSMALDMRDSGVAGNCKASVTGAMQYLATVKSGGTCSTASLTNYSLPTFPCESYNCSTAGAYVNICELGICQVMFDSFAAATQGDSVVLSRTTAGEYRDTGSTNDPVPTSGCEWVMGYVVNAGPSGGGLGSIDVTGAHEVCASFTTSPRMVYSGSQSVTLSTTTGTIAGSTVTLVPAAPANETYMVSIQTAETGVGGGTCTIQGTVGAQLFWTDADTGISVNSSSNNNAQVGSQTGILYTATNAAAATITGAQVWRGVTNTITVASGDSLTYSVYQVTPSSNNCSPLPVMKYRAVVLDLGSF